jgi:site-specific DNA-methyltransferase (adenine-specific)
LGWKNISVTVAPEDWDADTAKAYALADNRSAELAEWDQTVLASQLVELDVAGWDLAGLGFDVPEPELGEVVEDEVPELSNEPGRVALGDVWVLGRHRLMCGDSTSLDAVEMLTQKTDIDMVFTDPPYGISHSGKGITAPTARGNIVEGGNFGEILGDGDVTVAINAYNLCAALYPKATHIFWGANYYPSALPNGHGWLFWDKERVGDIFSGGELAFINRGVKVDIFKHQWHGIAKASEGGQSRIHPTQKPIALATWCFDRYGKPSTVLDLFGGSGSTLIAAEQTNRTAYLMELDPKYCDVIIKRWETLTGQTAQLIND